LEEGNALGHAAAVASLYLTIDDDMRGVSCPLLVLHDPRDQISKVDGSKHLMQISPATDKELVECPGALHDIILNEFDLFMGKALPWLVQHC